MRERPIKGRSFLCAISLPALRIAEFCRVLLSSKTVQIVLTFIVCEIKTDGTGLCTSLSICKFVPNTQQLSFQMKKPESAEKINTFGFKLLTRFELVTSSLPMRCATACAKAACVASTRQMLLYMTAL